MAATTTIASAPPTTGNQLTDQVMNPIILCAVFHALTSDCSALIMQVVLEYLKSRGFSQTEQFFKQEMNSSSAAAAAAGTAAPRPPANGFGTTSITDLASNSMLDAHTHTLGSIAAFNPTELSPEVYRESYRALAQLAGASGIPPAPASRAGLAGPNAPVVPATAHKNDLGRILWPVYLGCFIELFSKSFTADGK